MSTPIVVTGVNGRMGRTIAGLVIEDPSLELAGVVEKKDRLQGLDRFDCPVSSSLKDILSGKKGAVVIDFTSPEASLEVADICVHCSASAVMGTTGFSVDQLKSLQDKARQTPLFWAPNMSVGVNVLLKVLPELLNLLGDEYDLELMEIHHKFKKDSPSGTALKLAQVLADAKGVNLDEAGVFSRKGMIGERRKGEIGVQTLRGGDVVGDHTVYFFGPGERIEVTHRAHSRETFAQGAVRAAKWLADKKPGRLYAMADMFE
ncbi:4-hydroxy-tetrahydrodipicolinate reductase [Desulfonatronovibrio hydrogenovorans]|uniref:4-hydroxy-tetrahydrodipicolinate reductase n=1 Tax=Desulfonatronovibrio hydrogenovorans TaxID=53245 RepID=UPI00048E2B72|nr:4-hydroxy-tetrahydrodipicolinate reductase [Desulfonatronovibrio hydrogenovorans]